MPTEAVAMGVYCCPKQSSAQRILSETATCRVSTQRWLQVITTFIGTLLVGTFLTQASSPLLLHLHTASDLMLPQCHPIVMLWRSFRQQLHLKSCTLPSLPQTLVASQALLCRATGLRALQPVLLLLGAAALR